MAKLYALSSLRFIRTVPLLVIIGTFQFIHGQTVGVPDISTHSDDAMNVTDTVTVEYSTPSLKNSSLEILTKNKTNPIVTTSSIPSSTQMTFTKSSSDAVTPSPTTTMTSRSASAKTSSIYHTTNPTTTTTTTTSTTTNTNTTTTISTSSPSTATNIQSTVTNPITSPAPLTKLPTKRHLPDFSIYHKSSKIKEVLQTLIEEHPHLLKLDTVGNTKGGHEIVKVTLKDFKRHGNASTHLKILMTFGTYGQQLLPTESMIQLVSNLVKGYHNNNDFSHNFFNHSEMVILPLWNIDARIEMEKSNDYCPKLRNATVDLERNFAWEFKETRLPSYSGMMPFTEKETSVIKKIVQNDKFDIYITFNISTDRNILYPFSDAKSKRNNRNPDNYKVMDKCAKKAAEALNTKSGGRFWNYGQASRYLPEGALSGGRSMDYIVGEGKVPFGYTVGVWAPKMNQDSCFLDNNPNNPDLKAELEKVYPLYESLFECVLEWKVNQKPPKSHLPFPFEDDILNYGLLAIVAFVLFSIAIYFCRSKSCTCCCKRRPRNKYYDESSMNYNLLDVSDDDYVDSDDTEM